MAPLALLTTSPLSVESPAWDIYTKSDGSQPICPTKILAFNSTDILPSVQDTCTQNQWFTTSFTLLLWATKSSRLPFPGIMFNICLPSLQSGWIHSFAAFSALPWYRLSRSFSQPELFFCLSSSYISATKVSYSLTRTWPALFLSALSQSQLERLYICHEVTQLASLILLHQVCHLHSQ